MVHYCISNYAINSEKLCALGIIYRFDYDKILFNLEFFKMAKYNGYFAIPLIRILYNLVLVIYIIELEF